MKLHRLLSITVCALLIIGSLSGCGKKNLREPQDLEGFEFSWFSPWYWVNYPEDGASSYGDKRLAQYESVVKDYNMSGITNLEVSPEAMLTEIQKAALAGEKFADFIEVDYFTYQVLLINGSLQPLNEIEGFDTTQEKFYKQYTDMFSRDGKVYGLQYQIPQLSAGSFVYFNKTLLENENMESPYDLYEKGEWTFAKFKEMLVKLTKPNQDQWGFSGVDWHGNNIEKPFIFANGGAVARRTEDGQVKFAMQENQALEALQYLYDIETGNKTMLEVENADEGIKEFAAGKVAFWIGNIDNMGGINENMEDYEWGLVPIPKGPSATDYVQVDPVPRAWVMLNTNPDKVKAAIAFDAISDPVTGSVKDDEELYYSEFERRSLNKDSKAMEMYRLCVDKLTTDIGWVQNMDQLTPFIEACVKENSQTPSAAMEACGRAMQANLDRFYQPTPETGETGAATTPATE